jgi:hypothetical protein
VVVVLEVWQALENKSLHEPSLLEKVVDIELSENDTPAESSEIIVLVGVCAWSWCASPLKDNVTEETDVLPSG